ncbi:MAG: VCBS repeat-containing protein [Verrucomicrobia bacterium]|nr:VCBS repeat-containing protein [Verrucomicrobiota bacterium]
MKSQLLLLCWLGAARIGFGAVPSVPAGFGFSGPEVFPIDYQISQLHAADLDGDELTDVVIVNNARSKITFLINQTGQTNAAKVRPSTKRELNELPPDARFRIETIASEKRIAALVVADLNSDQRPDLAYYGEPRELVVQSNRGGNGWSAPKRFAIDDGQLSPNALAVGDLNGDRLPDLVVLGESQLYLLAQRPDHTLAEPEKIPFSGIVRCVQLLDLDGDGRDDLLLSNWDTPNPLRFRLQTQTGQLGPEIDFAMPPIRAYCADDLDGDHKTEIITIAQNSGRAQIANFVSSGAEKLAGEFAAGQLQILPLNRTSKARRGILWADLNGDHRTDLLVAEPEHGQLSLRLQAADGALGAARAFASFAGVSDIVAADWNGDGRSEVFLLSADERQIGVTSYDTNDRLPFPEILQLDGKPLAIAVGRLSAQVRPTLAALLDQENQRILFLRSADGNIKTQKLSESFKSNPTTLMFHDADQDGLADLVILIPYERIKILLQVSGRDFKEIDIAPPGGVMEQPWLSASDVDGDGRPELLLGQKNFLRAVVLKSEKPAQGGTNTVWSFRVKEQINGTASDSRIAGAAPLRSSANRVAPIFLLDAERKSVTLCERDSGGVWQAVRNVPLPFSEFNGVQGIAMGGTNENTLALMGANAVGWLPLGGSVWEIKDLDSYETPVKDARLTDVVSGDLDGDDRKDLVFLETAKNYLDLVTLSRDGKLVPANRWQVFEERTFRSRRSDLFEPREAVIADFTGDRKNDLLIIVHDRVLLYPQE